MKRLAIVGGRDFNNEELMSEYVAMFMRNYQEDEMEIPNIEIISGGAKGADSLGAKLALVWGVPVTVFKPEWDKYGKSAGFLRNQTIVDNCDIVLAFWDGMSRGTADTIEKAKRSRKPTFIVFY